MPGTLSASGTARPLAGFLGHRPVLIIMDRDIDLAQSFQHASTYQALVHDLLDLKLNRANFTAVPKVGKRRKSFALDPTTDSFWKDNAGALFPKAVEAADAEMKRLEAVEAEIKSKAASSASADTSGLSDAVSELERYKVDKERIHNHFQLLEATMGVVASRHVPAFFEVEDEIVAVGKVPVQTVLDMLADPSKGSYDDKIRLLPFGSSTVT